MNDTNLPQPGVDYPRSFPEFEARFASESSCRSYIRQLRWPEGFVCPRCGVMDDPSEMSRGLLLCRACGRQVSLTAGANFPGNPQAFPPLVLAMWVITHPKNRGGA